MEQRVAEFVEYLDSLFNMAFNLNDALFASE